MSQTQKNGGTVVVAISRGAYEVFAERKRRTGIPIKRQIDSYALGLSEKGGVHEQRLATDETTSGDKPQLQE